MTQKTSTIFEIPLALLSFLFYKAMKFLIGNLYTIYLTFNKSKASQWRVLSEEVVIKTALSLPVLMTKGPRWNTHAIIGTLGPFNVNQSIAIDLNSANQTTRSWIAVIYSFPGYETIASLESNRINPQEQWASLALKPGKYSIGLRYYNWGEKVIVPTVKVDDQIFVESQSIPSDINKFYLDLIQKKNWFYLSLHYYIFTLLRLRKRLPESLIKQEYLPVGATDTEFVYNYLTRGQALQISLDSDLVKNYDIYLTIYDRSSLPLTWSQITEENYLTKPIENNGYYLIRMRPKYVSLEEVLKQLPVQSVISDEETLTQKLKLTVKTGQN
ncbi:DUF6208 family protein [Gloeothece verrucosa]|uniref:Uncharacterized protein n=1 Tax=Gloeothece verrucosa (strain PCC 7822) TaxID=497965 RepID=E0U9N2_GLOV7|nr:DUF6208 family protein [Gloeothece verrucosa]ADN13833.1 conserved hypothetical protein [Gloeothece verrucosa PCC 7822]